MKKLISFFLFLMLSTSVYAVDMYNSIATAYVTTTISQNVVFNGTMQQGGTFNFSVLAHNGGGRAGQSDTANVKIQFYTAANALVTSTNSNYSANLPNPNAVCGNPCIDPAVPWTTLSTSITLTAAQASTVAYAKISMYGIDGSYWAGDYGPWYRAPTFTLNGGANMAYNPEFGPYNGTTAQGWTSSPGFGACQGAWGGSNACIVNSSGTPGTSTTGLVANQNGGGPSATGGTTSGQPGGYNSSMSTTNAAPAPAPTVTGTTTTNSTSNVIVGNQQKTITTPTTVTTYSDGTSTTTRGTATTTVVSTSAFTGVHFGPAQVADTQWNVYACTQTNSCQIYSTSPGITYNTGSPTYIQSNQYITFVPNTDNTDKAQYPWRMLLVNSDGTFTDLGSCAVLVQGTDSNGYIYLFVSNANYNGTVFSGNLGLSGQGMTFTGDQNPTMSQTETLAGSMSADPLAAGATGGTAAGPTVVSTSTSNVVTTSSTSTSNNSDSVSVSTTTNGGGTLSTSTDTFVGTTTTTVTTTTTTPVTTTTYSDGSTTSSSGTSSSSTSTSTSYSISSTSAPLYSSASPNTNGNSVYIKQASAWSSTNVYVTQEGNNNAVTGINNGWAYVDGNGSEIRVNQYGQGNITGIKMNAWGNNINLNQGSTSADANNNILMFDSHGNGNAATVNQLSSSNSASIKLTSDINTVNLTQQTGTLNKSYITVNGYWNTVNNTQTGSGNLAIINISGDNNSATVNQTGTNHSTLLNLINAGGANNVSVIQTGTGDAYSLQQTCTNPAGCSVSVIRNK